MAEALPFTACVDHLHYGCREVVTFLAAKYNFKSKKSLEQRQAEITSIREKYHDIIPVIVQKADNSPISYEEKRFLVRAEYNLEEFFTWFCQNIHRYKRVPHSLCSIVKHKDPIFKKLMSSVYEEYKDEDGCLYISLSGEVSDLLSEPSPSNISTSTFFVTELPFGPATNYKKVCSISLEMAYNAVIIYKDNLFAGRKNKNSLLKKAGLSQIIQDCAIFEATNSELACCIDITDQVESITSGIPIISWLKDIYLVALLLQKYDDQ